MVRHAALFLALTLALVGCAGGAESETADDQAADGTALASETTSTTSSTSTTPPDEETVTVEVPESSTTSVTSPDLVVTAPEEEPEAAGFEVVEVGDGPTVEIGDQILAAWEMLAVGSGEVVESTANDFGGPLPIVVGAGFVPAALDEALAGQTVGSKLDVQFPAGMEDLPDYLDADQAYVLVVQIVELLENDAPTTTAPQPTTTVPTGPGADLLVPAAGPLAASPPAGAAAPTRNSSTVVTLGSGAELAEGDTVELDYVVVSWTTGEVVLSTAEDFGGSQTIVLGDIEVPRILESAIFRQPVGSRVQVIYAPELPDLPDGLDPTDAYVVAVDIVAKS